MGKKKIIFIEDEPDQIMMVKIRLEASDFEFISAMDGKEGLEMVHKESPDLILLDAVMPKMSGFEVCRRLKQDTQTKDIPVIMITASGARDIDRKCLACGADEVIRKPYESITLVAKIKKFFSDS